MNCDVAQFEKQFIVAAGLEGHCQLYSLRYKVITPKVENEGGIYSQVLEAYVFFVEIQYRYRFLCTLY